MTKFGYNIVILLVGCLGQITLAQQDYPATRYSGFGPSYQSGFATSAPSQPDAPNDSNPQDFRAMSPSSWSNPGPTAATSNTDNRETVGNDNDFQPPSLTAPKSVIEPANQPFQSASFARPGELPGAPSIPRDIRTNSQVDPEIGALESGRYPLTSAASAPPPAERTRLFCRSRVQPGDEFKFK